MRHLFAICLLAGCYKPSTESCYYTCATQGAPCPSGLTCVAGNLCAAPGESCSIGGDAMPDSDPGIDAPPAVCGDGMRMPGELCFNSPLTFTSTTAPFDGVLADRNGDSRLDLLYVTAVGMRTHANLGTALDTNVSNSPISNNARNMRPLQLDMNPSAELLITSDAGLESWGFVSSLMNYTRTGMYPVVVQVASFEVGKMTDGTIGDIVGLDNASLRVYRIDGPGTATPMGSTPVTPNSRVVVGQLTSDLRSDVLLLSPTGITAFIGSPAGLGAGMSTPMTSPVADAKIGDLDGDGDGDIVFAVQVTGGSSSQLGVMRGNGTGSFAPPQLITVQDLGGALEVVDLDNDGREDVIAIRTGPASQRALLLYRSRPDASFEPPVVVPLPGTSAKLSARGSFNGDMVPDIVVTDTLDSKIYVFPSNP